MMRVFLSYASSDRAVAQAVASALERPTVDIWDYTDPETGLRAGTDLVDGLVRKMREADFAVFLISPASLKAGCVVRAEAKLVGGAGSGTRVIPLVVRDGRKPVAMTRWPRDFAALTGLVHIEIEPERVAEGVGRLLDELALPKLARRQPVHTYLDLHERVERAVRGRASLRERREAMAMADETEAACVQGEYDTALNRLGWLITLLGRRHVNGRDIRYLRCLQAKCSLDRGAIETATADLLRLVKEDPHDENAWAGLGFAFLATGQNEAAAAAFHRAWQISKCRREQDDFSLYHFHLALYRCGQRAAWLPLPSAESFSGDDRRQVKSLLHALMPSPISSRTIRSRRPSHSRH